MSSFDQDLSWKEDVILHHKDRYLAMESRDAFQVKFMPYRKGNSLSETACWFPLVPTGGSSGVPCTTENYSPGVAQNHVSLLHVLTIGEGISNRLIPERTGEMAEYAKKYYEHELAHARHTEPRRDLLQMALEQHQVPFKLYNVFEDARIEHLRREELKRSGENFAFRWDHYEQPNQFKDPGQIFWGFIFHEGDREKVGKRIPVNDPSAPTQDTVTDIESFYQRTLKASKLKDLVAIAAEFRDKYGTKSGSGNQSGAGSSGKGFSPTFDPEADIEESARGAQVAANAKPGEKHGPVKGMGDMSVADNVLNDPEAIKSLLTVYAGSERDDFSAKSRRNEAYFFGHTATARVDERLASRLAARMEPPAGEGSTFRSDRTSRKIDRREFAMDRDRFYVHVDEQDRARPPQVLLVADCSGSMNETGLPLTKNLLAAFSNLATKHKLTGTVLLSGDFKGPEFYRMDLPIPRDRISKLQATGGGEALQATFNANKDLIAKADHIFVITDGEIVDSGVNRDLFRSAGKTSIGVFLGDNERAATLGKHFDVALAADSPEQLAQLIKQSMAMRGTKPR